MKNKVFKRMLAVFLCLCFVCAYYLPSAIVYASQTISVSDLMDIQFSNWSELPADFKALAEAYYKSSRSGSFNSLFKNAQEIPLSWFKILKDGTPILNPVGTVFYLLDDGDLYVEGDLHHSSGGRHRTGDEGVIVPSNSFNDYVNTTDTQYFPKNANSKVSYRTDSRWHNANDSYYSSRYDHADFYSGDSKFAPVGGRDEMYIVLFQRTDTESYFGRYQYHFTVTSAPVWFEDRDEISHYAYTLDCEYWDIRNREETLTTVTIFNGIENAYFDLYLDGYMSFDTYTTYDTYLSFSKSSRLVNYSPELWNILQSYDSISTTINLNTSHFTRSLANHSSNCTYNNLCDIGYYASIEPIETTYRIDTNKIPDNYYITVNGDTVYDYSITNPDTGQTDTISNYITNNYTYVTNNNPSSGGSGSVGGNVTVGGHIDVGGSVDVDINVKVPDININVSGGNVGGGNNLGDYVDASGANTDLGNVLSKIPELSKGFIDYLKDFFAWLPAELYGLIVLLLVVIIWKAAVKR